MKKLYLLRHAEAEPKGAGGKDSLRALTEYGRQQAAEVGRQVRAKKISFGIILTSPYVRARQTAEIVAGICGAEDVLVQEPSLASGCTVEDMKKILRAYQDYDTVLCVGHEPDFGEIAAYFLRLESSRPLKKAELVEIDCAESRPAGKR